MPAKKNTKTLYSKTNPVDITSLLTNSNVNANVNLNPFQNQTGGKRTNNEAAKKLKKHNDDDNNSETDTDNDSELSVDSQYEKGTAKGKDKIKNKKKKNKDEDDEDEPEEEPDEEPEEQNEEPDENEDEDDEINEDDANKAIDDNDGLEENDDENDDEEAKTVVSENDDAEDDDDKETLDTNNKCYSKYAKDKNDDFDLDEYFKDDDIVITKTGRVGKPILFKYEKVRLLSDRSRQLAEGAKPMIKNTVGLSHKEIALLELKNKLIPLIIERPIPNAGSERWRLSELEIPDYDSMLHT